MKTFIQLEIDLRDVRSTVRDGQALVVNLMDGSSIVLGAGVVGLLHSSLPSLSNDPEHTTDWNDFRQPKDEFLRPCTGCGEFATNPLTEEPRCAECQEEDRMDSGEG